jgi:hypothetical protein
MSKAETQEPERKFLGGWATLADGRRVPVSEDFARKIMEECEARKAKREADMPTEQDAINSFFEAFERLRELGWREAVYCPKDGSSFKVIEPGGTGIHPCHYSGKWPDGSWWIEHDGDLSPSRPALFRLFPEDQAKEDARKAELMAKFRAEQEATNNG